MEIEAEIEDAVAGQLARLNALDDAWHERTNAETLYTDGDLTLAAYAAALQVVTSYSSIDRQPLDRDLYRKLDKGERRCCATSSITQPRWRMDYWCRKVSRGTCGATSAPPSASMSACSTWRRRARPRSLISRTSPRASPLAAMPTLMASTTANAAALAGAADLKGRMLVRRRVLGHATSAGAVRGLEDDGDASARPETRRHDAQDRIRRRLLAAPPEADCARRDMSR